MSERNDLLLASDAERERSIDLLRAGSADGRLTVEELEDRTARALGARTRVELDSLTADLPVPARMGPEGDRTLFRRGARPVRNQLPAYLAVSVLLVVIWAATGADYFWPIWPMLGWGLGIARHARYEVRTSRTPRRGLSAVPRRLR